MKSGKKIKSKRGSLRLLLFLIGSAVAGLALSAVPSPGFAGNFSVNPTSLDLGIIAKSGAFSVTNSGDEKLNCQVDLKEWSQDGDGKDVYADTKDLVFFPKIMTIEPREQRAIRVGIKVPAGAKEKTYRLFVEEIPSRKKGPEAQTGGKLTAGLTIAFRYAVPIFVKPLKPQESAVIESMDMSKGIVDAVLKNNGNVHIKLFSAVFKGMAADRKELFTKEIAGWYILQGMSKRYEATIPKEVCRDLATIEVVAQAENLTINGTLNVQRKMCGQ